MADRRWGRFLFWLLFLVLIGMFVGLPIASGHSRLQRVAPEDVGRFMKSIWDYWRRVFESMQAHQSSSSGLFGTYFLKESDIAATGEEIGSKIRGATCSISG